MDGTVLIFGCIALCAVALSLLYQPVEWHIKPQPLSDVEDLKRIGSVYAPTETQMCAHCQNNTRRCTLKILSGEYLLNSDNAQFTGYEIIDPGTPMMSKSNDGWYSMTPAKRSIYSSRVSLTSGFVSRKTSYANLGAAGSVKDNRRGEKRSRIEAPVDEDDLQLENLDEFKAEVKSNRTSYSNLYKEGKRDKLKVPKNNELKIEEAEEDCPSLVAPQDVKSGRLRLNIDNLSIPKEIADQQLELNGDHRYKTQTSIGTTHDSPVVTFNDWNNTKSIIPSRNTSAISMQNFNPRPRRNPSTNSFHAEKDLLNSVRKELEEYVSKDDQCTCNQLRLQPKQNNTDQDEEDDLEDTEEEQFTLWQKIFIFFDLDLLKDLTYVNLMVGVTIASFAELNYSILTPFVMADYGLTKTETATSMSLLGAMDISVRFFVPFIAGKIGWENKTFFLFGVLGMALGRICKCNRFIFKY